MGCVARLSLGFGSMAVLGFAMACGEATRNAQAGTGGAQASSASSASGGANASGGVTANGGSRALSSGGAATCDVGVDPCPADTTELVDRSDTSNCLLRKSLDCDREAFDAELQEVGGALFEPCAAVEPHDGCGRLLLDFDANGCLSSLTTPIEPDEGLRDHLGALRACLKPIFEDARFACLPSAHLEYRESCFVR
ncbi:MAG TPA: hypothetical protein VFQ35_18365 [Polyangiaceae bacterium]|nr:hypothetical protein [Polyangiaceae bacterium]